MYRIFICGIQCYEQDWKLYKISSFNSTQFNTYPEEVCHLEIAIIAKKDETITGHVRRQGKA